MRELADLGLERRRECVLVGAAVMIERAVGEYQARGDVGLGWLADLLRRGGLAPGDGGRASERDRVLGEMNLWQQGYDSGVGE